MRTRWPWRQPFLAEVLQTDCRGDAKRRTRRGGRKRLGPETQFKQRLHQHALGNAKGADRSQPPVADAVVNSPSGNAEEFGCLIDGDAATESWLERRCFCLEARCFSNQGGFNHYLLLREFP